MLLINEIYAAICGESRFIGRPCTLVRLTGCHLRCHWCDSAHAFREGEWLEVAEVLAQVGRNQLKTVLVTGGEPLLQEEVGALLASLVRQGRTVLLETSGTLGPPDSLRLDQVPAGVHRIVDLKAPGSGVGSEAIDWEGIDTLAPDDELKIVCADRNDFEWARDLVLDGERLPKEVPVSFSPVYGRLEPPTLAAWILADGLLVTFQIQLHRVLWPEADRGV
jgi:7-carboxy-7-deazaguanine synthase